jgi:alpha-L-rhamnosidase
MNRWFVFSCFMLLGLTTACPVSRGISEMTVKDLRCEYLENPLGIDQKVPRLSWKLESELRGQRQTAYRVLVASSLGLLEEDQGDLWDTGIVTSERTTHIEYAGSPLSSRALCFWKVRSWDRDRRKTEFSAPAFWSMGLLDQGDWSGTWIQADRTPPETPPEPLEPGPPPPYFRKGFQIDKPIKRAVMYVTALGLAELHLNGRPVTEDVFLPEWTDYSTRIQYRAFDVTELLLTGENALGAVVADGWYSGYVGWRKERGNYGLVNSLLLQLEVEYPDGSTTRVSTDPTWRWSEGPILSADLLMGQHEDGRLRMAGWSRPGFDDSAWDPVQAAPAPAARLTAQPSQAVRVIECLEPVGISEPLPRVFVFDLGQNISGWARLKVTGRPGDKITLRFAERLSPDGTLYTENLRDAKATDSFICRGDGEEIFEPRFTFHGFQYVEVTGYPGIPEKDAVTACALSSDCPETGRFSCSHPMVNKLFANLLWGQRGNYLSIPTDCPQRDERLGWMGDAQIFVRTGSYNLDTAAFFTKWMRDVTDAQSKEGAFPDFAPRLNDKTLMGFEAAPAWGDAGVIIPWTIYCMYGDRRIIAEHWDAMERWMAFLESANPNLIRTRKVGNNYGDWLSIRADTPKDLLATAFWSLDAQLMARMGAVLGKKNRASAYRDLYERLRGVFQEEFLLTDGRIKGETQTGYLLALAMDLIPAELRSRAAEHLTSDIKERGGHLSTGFVGCGFLNPVLTELGYADVAYRLLLKDSFPSWGYSIRQGATTIWERWDGWTEDRGFQDPGMNSFNHYAFGAVGEWLYRYVAGIDSDPDEPGFKHVRIRPFLGDGIEWAQAEYESIHGRIASRWSSDGDSIQLDISIPANTRATVHIPFPDPARILEGEIPAEQSEGVEFSREENGRVLYSVGSGTYSFRFPLER